MKIFFNSNKLKASNLIQPIFIEEGLKSKKVIKGLGVNYSHTIQSAKKLFHLTLKKVLKILFFLLFQRLSKKNQKILIFITNHYLK